MKKRVALLHGAGYVGGELIRLLLDHPDVELDLVTSRAFSGKPLWDSHPDLRGCTDVEFTDPQDLTLAGIDAVLVAAEHGKGAKAVLEITASGYEGPIVDLSADFRFEDASTYEEWFGFVHPAPEMISSYEYGLPEVYAPYPDGTRYVANPGCFATGLTLALWPVARRLESFHAFVTALTGASGSGAKPKATTHFPTREGNVRAYKILQHQHLPEVLQVLGEGADIAFVPASGPWTRGIWGTAQVHLPRGIDRAEIDSWFESAYEGKPFVRLWKDALPELRYAVRTPFCDIGWMVRDRNLVIGFAEDNLLKGAASQAIQNLNLLLHLPETAGLLPDTAGRAVPQTVAS